MEITILSDEQVCANCRYYYPHYVKYSKTRYLNMETDGKDMFHMIEYGHCCMPRIKNRKATDTCSHFEMKEGE